MESTLTVFETDEDEDETITLFEQLKKFKNKPRQGRDDPSLSESENKTLGMDYNGRNDRSLADGADRDATDSDVDLAETESNESNESNEDNYAEPTAIPLYDGTERVRLSQAHALQMLDRAQQLIVEAKLSLRESDKCVFEIINRLDNSRKPTW